jgi:hypothetical protein
VQKRFPFSFKDHSSYDTSISVSQLFAAGFKSHAGAVASNTLAVAIWCVIANIMYRKRVFVNL